MAKTLIAFFSRADEKLCPGAVIKDGLPLNGSSVGKSDTEIDRWLKTNGLL